MAHTFLYTIETESINAAVKFQSRTKTISEFMVTFLTAPHIKPFTMVLENSKWKIACQVPDEVRAVEHELLDAARKFQR
jgi:hypothetical protein